ncbi:hypothetical protein Esi_0151_0023 [Ectocarpus siliculosus]|uniref:Uncharacterized protein n=1 Tax=Ectocarpus siliculosus TaxID=2880 RepID=D8LFQ8_ECTSI|nr:hypothetical protein Esi_0151_0023 [Ectocarpus siliculosus]|eukprot:CBN75632.1 hypothetical protein Esi_0151_0023 [Ectocarpus siliculosus]
MSALRVLVASLVSCLTITYIIGGNSQTWPSDAAAATAIASSDFLFSVDVVLDESAVAVPLGIRDGQTVAEAALGFCHEQGLDGAMQSALMPQLMKVLEDGITEVVGPPFPVGDEASIPSSDAERVASDAQRDVPDDSKLADPVLTLGISIDGNEERPLFYYTGQGLLMTVPLNVNGVETVLQIFRDSNAKDLASDFCRREEFGLEGSFLESCSSQMVDIVHRAVATYERQDDQSGEPPERTPFTFKVPVTLAGLQLHAEFKTTETPRTSARRFCTPNLPVIESALGLDAYEGEDEGRGEEESTGVGFFLSEGRKSLREACTVVVEDAINAVLLGMRERVLEAELTQANSTYSSSYDDSSDGWPQEGSARGAWAASQIAADTTA